MTGNKNENQLNTRCGYVAIAGRPNVGKSTLLNRLIGQKLSITAHKPQTTRHALLGIHTSADAQFVYIDTPGIHGGGKRTLNRVLNKTASSAATGADVMVLVVQALVWNDDDNLALETVRRQEQPWILAVNKVDQVQPKNRLLPWLQGLTGIESAVAVLPISATKGDNVETLEQEIGKLLPEAAFMFAEDTLTDRSSRFLASELVREQLTRFLAQELPYSVSVEIEKFEETATLSRVFAVIWVEKQSQKSIVIGKNGASLKEIGSRARVQMQNLFGTKVHLELWCKVKDGWADDAAMIRNLGYESE
ncbi:GTPase Era [Chromatiales bacterium (ex Bugula neritina AB1)]|nr:GTPase Era [Chromatiales bacterium (ex Bugula neritina AB1)]